MWRRKHFSPSDNLRERMRRQWNRNSSNGQGVSFHKSLVSHSGARCWLLWSPELKRYICPEAVVARTFGVFNLDVSAYPRYRLTSTGFGNVHACQKRRSMGWGWTSRCFEALAKVSVNACRPHIVIIVIIRNYNQQL